jgi:hypothetical protein
LRHLPKGGVRTNFPGEPAVPLGQYARPAQEIPMVSPSTRSKLPKADPVPAPNPAPAVWIAGLAGVVVILLLFVLVVI